MSCVLTLALDDEAQDRFESLRQRHFPIARNRIPAHLTLFHTLPETDETVARLREISGSQAAFSLDMTAPKSIGRGVAYFFDAPSAVLLHRRLSVAFAEHLSAQDRQGFRPHVVVQNKVTPEVAKETLALLLVRFEPIPVRAVGLDLWRYLDGPWEYMQRFSFFGEGAERSNAFGGTGL
ncbi:2'-5' RNA ligase family protein [Terriglobus roseus]|uniref:2'-5' RNA ligase superfamily protein n=1 Tax=Terriglobus roseus TaxID=392734 RepID=A0A1H4M7E2_9BACT|nr:2'-5' RNA ligase family protein [Terriglobus roseus]SEB78991.1 2'-5' RNA ligase superfamily protein [Terriglobus roseus]